MENTGVTRDFSGLSSFLTPSTLWLGFVVILGIFAIVSAILMYHWHKYAYNKAVAKRTITIYFSVSGVFILLLIVTLLTGTLS